jgi:hypothetical protein
MRVGATCLRVISIRVLSCRLRSIEVTYPERKADVRGRSPATAPCKRPHGRAVTRLDMKSWLCPPNVVTERSWSAWARSSARLPC